MTGDNVWDVLDRRTNYFGHRGVMPICSDGIPMY